MDGLTAQLDWFTRGWHAINGAWLVVLVGIWAGLWLCGANRGRFLTAPIAAAVVSVFAMLAAAGVISPRRAYGTFAIFPLFGLLAGIPIPAMDEAKHFKMVGTTGTGKSTAIRELLEGALAGGDVILNPFDPRAHNWNIYGELTAAHDVEQIVRSMIPDHDGADKSWRGYARMFGSIRQVISAWLRLAIFQTMTGGEGDQRLWFVVDEIDALGPIDRLENALVRLRKFGGRCVLGFPAEVEQLPDLQCYLEFASHPAWFKIRLDLD